LVLENRDRDILLIEGQGAITHPLYSGVTLSMLHGFAPHVLILCHQVNRRIMRGTVDTPVADLRDLISLYEQISAPVFPARVVGIALNTMGLSEEQARQALAEIRDRCDLAVTDVLRWGPAPLVDALRPWIESKKIKGKAK